MGKLRLNLACLYGHSIQLVKWSRNTYLFACIGSIRKLSVRMIVDGKVGCQGLLRYISSSLDSPTEAIIISTT